MVTALGRPDMVTLREAAEALWLVKESEPERPISPSELRPLVIDQLGPPRCWRGDGWSSFEEQTSTAVRHRHVSVRSGRP